MAVASRGKWLHRLVNLSPRQPTTTASTMPNRQISRDVKIAAIKLHERELLQLPDILDCCGFSERTFYRIPKLWRDTGMLSAPTHLSVADLVSWIVKTSVMSLALSVPTRNTFSMNYSHSSRTIASFLYTSQPSSKNSNGLAWAEKSSLALLRSEMRASVLILSPGWLSTSPGADRVCCLKNSGPLAGWNTDL